MKIDKKLFIHNYKNNTLLEVAKIYEVSTMTIYRWKKLIPELQGKRKKGSGRKKRNPFI